MTKFENSIQPLNTPEDDRPNTAYSRQFVPAPLTSNLDRPATAKASIAAEYFYLEPENPSVSNIEKFENSIFPLKVCDGNRPLTSFDSQIEETSLGVNSVRAGSAPAAFATEYESLRSDPSRDENYLVLQDIEVDNDTLEIEAETVVDESDFGLSTFGGQYSPRERTPEFVEPVEANPMVIDGDQGKQLQHVNTHTFGSLQVRVVEFQLHIHMHKYLSAYTYIYPYTYL